MTGYVYMTASQKRGTIYIGVTNDIGRRIPEHKAGTVACGGWSGLKSTSTFAIQREKSLKRWPRRLRS
jgi:putative endonuclease